MLLFSANQHVLSREGPKLPPKHIGICHVGIILRYTLLRCETYERQLAQNDSTISIDLSNNWPYCPYKTFQQFVAHTTNWPLAMFAKNQNVTWHMPTIHSGKKKFNESRECLFKGFQSKVPVEKLNKCWPGYAISKRISLCNSRST